MSAFFFWLGATSPGDEDAPIEELYGLMTTRAKNALRDEGIATVRLLAQTSMTTLMLVPNLGGKTVAQLRELMNLVGLGLGMTDEEYGYASVGLIDRLRALDSINDWAGACAAIDRATPISQREYQAACLAEMRAL